MSGIGNTVPGLATEEEQKPKNVSCSKIQRKCRLFSRHIKMDRPLYFATFPKTDYNTIVDGTNFVMYLRS